MDNLVDVFSKIHDLDISDLLNSDEVQEFFEEMDEYNKTHEDTKLVEVDNGLNRRKHEFTKYLTNEVQTDENQNEIVENPAYTEPVENIIVSQVDVSAAKDIVTVELGNTIYIFVRQENEELALLNHKNQCVSETNLSMTDTINKNRSISQEHSYHFTKDYGSDTDSDKEMESNIFSTDDYSSQHDTNLDENLEDFIIYKLDTSTGTIYEVDVETKNKMVENVAFRNDDSAIYNGVDGNIYYQVKISKLPTQIMSKEEILKSLENIENEQKWY